MNRRKQISLEDLTRLYIDESMTTEQIAAQLGPGETTIRRRLQELDIPLRPHGPRPDDLDHADHYEQSPQLAYAVGLIATDGNLSSDGRHMTLVSADRDLLETFRNCLGLNNAIAPVVRWENTYYRVQWGNRSFYNWLERIGLTPAESLSLGPLDIPDVFMADFVRGCIDGDGSIRVYTDRWNVFKNEKYVYERLVVELVSASEPFLTWVRASIARLVGVSGSRSKRDPLPGSKRVRTWELKYAKHESTKLLNWLYYSPTVPCLGRKRAKALPFLSNPDQLT